MNRRACKQIGEKDYSNPLEWEERLFFCAMKNQDISRLTNGEFRDEKNPNSTHPVFLLRQIEREAFKFCPCSTKEYNRDGNSYIPQNSKTVPNGLRVDKRSFILHGITFNLTTDNPLTDRMPLLGQVSEDDIVGDYYKMEPKK